MIVMKFGGSSVDCAESIGRVTEIVRRTLDRQPVVIVSAMAKTTRRLREAAEAAAAGNRPEALDIFDEIEAFHRRESHGVVPPAGRPALDAALSPYFNDLRTQLDELHATRALTPRAADAVESCGELLASTILSFAFTHAGLDATWVDCRRVMVTDHEFTRARPLYGPTDARLREALLPLLRQGKVPVMGGYVGATLQGVTTTLGREGSDFSAAIVGAALEADEVQIWTDVDGIRTADPKICSGARRVRSLSFNEALELSCSGSKKPHYGTLGPASRAGVPIHIVDSRNPGAEGTVIGRRNPEAPPTVKSMACLSLSHVISVRGSGGDPTRSLFDLCERFRPALMVLDAGPQGADLGLSRQERLPEIQSAILSAVGGSAEVWVTPGRTAVSLVSEDLATHPELAEKALAAVQDQGARLLTEGVAAPVVRFLVGEEEIPSLFSRLHAELIPGSAEEAVE